MTGVIDSETITLARELEVTTWDDRRVDSPTESRAIDAFASYLGSQEHLRPLSERLGPQIAIPDSRADLRLRSEQVATSFREIRRG